MNKEEKREPIYERHCQLIDKKFSSGLTDEEQRELDGIKEKLNQMDAAFYEEAIEFLKKKIEEMLQN